MLNEKRMKSRVAAAVGLALGGVLLSASLHAGFINDTTCGADPDTIACVGAWDLANVAVQLYHADGTVFGTFDPVTGAYSTMIANDSFASMVGDTASGDIRARVTGKVWPVGEPTGIKAVTNDTATKNGKPQNCLINTAYLEGAYLDSATPAPVICSSPFQSHKRFKIAMLPSTVAGVANGADGKPIDLVFNVTDGGGERAYQVFSKINNYTGVRLKGYKIVVGTGTGAAFQSADQLNIEDKLFISLGIGEGKTGGGAPVADGSNLFDDDDGLATFSHGLFGAPDTHFLVNGYFDIRAAGFNVAQGCTLGACPSTYQPYPGIDVPHSDLIYSTTALPSNYAGPATAPLTAPLFGDWIPFEWAPKGIFFDFDNDPTTDADLVAWWDGTNWRKNYDSGFAIVTPAEFNAWASNPLYAIDTIEDTVNLGINYIVKVGDGIGSTKITIRVIPVVADSQVPPAYVGTTVPPLVPTTDPVVPPVAAPVTSGGGGGCTIGGNGPLDPTLPALLAAALGFIGWRRVKARK